MIEMKLTDIKWMDKDLAARLESEGVTVRSMASTSSAEFLKRHPYVGTINAWLLPSEAQYLVNVEGAGLWEPEREKQGKLIRVLEGLEARQYQRRPQTTPRPRPDDQFSARVRRIRLSQGLSLEADRL